MISKKLPLLNIFERPFEKWENKRDITYEEAREYCPENPMSAVLYGIPQKKTYTIVSHFDYASYMASIKADNEVENFVDNYLDNSSIFKEWRTCMPIQTPKALSDYQRKYPNYNQEMVDNEINKINCVLSEGQTLIHAGLWHCPNNECITDRPLSTTFCAQVALRNAEHKNKAFRNGRIDIMVLTVKNPKTCVFVFRQKGTDKGHEKEVLFGSGAKLRKISEKLVSNYTLCEGLDKSSCKNIPIYVLEVEIS